MEHSITIEENPVDEKPCITKVHDELRKVIPECYEPVAVSIGPYYHKCDPDRYPGLEEMQQFKQLYLNLLLERRNGSREYYLSELKKLATKARKCYAGPMSTIDDNEFTEMMLLDSCFVVEFIRKMNYERSDDPIGTVPWRLNPIKRDMILLENQLPYFVLSKFYDMTKYDGEKSLEEMAMSCFNASLPRPRLYFSNSNSKGKKSSEEMPMSCFNDSFPTPGLYFSNRDSKGEKINHLLHLVQIFCRPSVPKDKKCSSDESTSAQRPGSVKTEGYELKNHMRTVVELQEAGVNFEKVSEVYSDLLKDGTWNDYVSLFDIEFKGGVMKVPCFKVDASTKTLLRNLIAYEQEYFEDVEPKYFTDFAMLMNQLINTENDIKELRCKDIIINYLGDDKDVSQLFNTLIVGVYHSEKSYFLEVRENVNKHCKIPFNRIVASVNRDLVKQPLNLTLLYLTVLQTIIAIIALRATK